MRQNPLFSKQPPHVSKGMPRSMSSASALDLSARTQEPSAGDFPSSRESGSDGNLSFPAGWLHHRLHKNSVRQSWADEQGLCRRIPSTRDIDDRFGTRQPLRRISHLPACFLKRGRASGAASGRARGGARSGSKGAWGLLREESSLPGLRGSGFREFTQATQLRDCRYFPATRSARRNWADQDITLLESALSWLERGGSCDWTDPISASASTGCTPTFLREATARTKRLTIDAQSSNISDLGVFGYWLQIAEIIVLWILA